MSIEIKFGNLKAYRVNKPSDKSLTLESLNESNYNKIFGEFKIMVNGKAVPHLFFKNKGDVSIEYWVDELVNLFKSIKKREKKYIIYGAEQGDSAYRFVRKSDSTLLSVIDCPIMEGKADTKWQNIEIGFSELKDAFEKFKLEFLQALKEKAPQIVEMWSEKFKID